MVEGGFIDTATIIWAAGIRSSESVDGIDVEKLKKASRVVVDEFGRTKHKNVYAVGDLSGFLDENNNLYPAMVENAIQTGNGVARNILNDIRGKEQSKIQVKMHGIMVSVGNYFAVSEIMGRSLGRWLSIIIKFMVNIHYLWTITGFRGQPCISIMRSLIANSVKPDRKTLYHQYACLVTTLRLFLGGMWLYEGIQKALEGWFTNPKLAEFLGMASDSHSAATGSALYITKIEEAFSIKTGIINFCWGLKARLWMEPPSPLWSLLKWICSISATLT